jgi:hypothetical protein
MESSIDKTATTQRSELAETLLKSIPLQDKAVGEIENIKVSYRIIQNELDQTSPKIR